jgi:hypothetical protein
MNGQRGNHCRVLHTCPAAVWSHPVATRGGGLGLASFRITTYWEREIAVDIKKPVNVTEALDGATITGFTLVVLALSAIIIFADGFDINNVAYVGSVLISGWGISDPSALCPIFSASLFGMLFGAPILDYLGDQYGRKKAILASGLIFSIFTWAQRYSLVPSANFLRFV